MRLLVERQERHLACKMSDDMVICLDQIADHFTYSPAYPTDTPSLDSLRSGTAYLSQLSGAGLPGLS